MAFYPDERIALFIDGANLYSTAKTLDFDLDYKRILELFREKGRLVTANYYTAVLEKEEFSSIQPLIDFLDYNGYTVITKAAKQVVNRDGKSVTKGNMDVEIVVDALNLAPYIDHIVLFSGDGDFRALIRALQSKGVRVTVASTLKSNPPMLADELRRQADSFLELSDIERLIGREPTDFYN